MNVYLLELLKCLRFGVPKDWVCPKRLGLKHFDVLGVLTDQKQAGLG